MFTTKLASRQFLRVGRCGSFLGNGALPGESQAIRGELWVQNVVASRSPFVFLLGG